MNFRIFVTSDVQVKIRDEEASFSILTDDLSRFGLPRSILLIKTAPLFYLAFPYFLVIEYTPIEMPYRKVITFGQIGIKAMNTHACPERRYERSP